MKIWDSLHKKGLRIFGRFENPFSQEAVPTSPKVRGEIFRRLESRIAEEEDRKFFPFKKIVIRLQPRTKHMVQKFIVEFMESSSLKSDVYKRLRDIPVQLPSDLEISVELQENILPVGRGSPSAPLFEMIFLDPVISPRPRIPDLRLEVLRGNAEQPVYRISKDRLLVGCLPEVQDREGRLVRKNNIVFPHEGNEINATVGNMHARIWFDYKRQEFCVMDESSRYGTRIVRGGHTIEVPAENPRGVGLHNGDEVYFGQACLRFVLVKNGG